MTTWLRALALLLAGWLAAVAHAHPMPESRVLIDTTEQGLALETQLPLNRLEFAFGQPLADDPATVMARYGGALDAYVRSHIHVRSGGQDWILRNAQLSVSGNDAGAELHARLEYQAPAGASARTPTLVDDAVTHEVRTHRILVFLRNDWQGGFAGEPPLLVGELQSGQTELAIPLGGRSAIGSVLRLLQGGARHIAEGTDHIVFLLMLLVAAPLAGSAWRWRGVRTSQDALRHCAWVVTAFTLGHSITLLLGSTGLVQIPAQLVETLVAVTILVAAVHAWRPLFRKAETTMALLFGLVHGMAFSASLSGAGLTAGQHALALLSFNVGIEAMQLALVIAVLPPLVAVALRSETAYRGVRLAIAGAGAVVAVLWIGQRLELQGWPAWSWLDAGPSAMRWPLLGIWALAGVLWWRSRGKDPEAAPVDSAS